MPARHGKIARLPLTIREELNTHLREARMTGAALAAWLNALPEVRASLQTHFNGKPIREQNISQWRRGGYQEWLQQQQHRELTTRLCHEVTAMAESEGVSPTAILDRLTVLHYAATAHEMRHATQGKGRWQLMRQLCADYTKLRRTEIATQRLEHQRSQLLAELPTPDSPTSDATPTNSPI